MVQFLIAKHYKTNESELTEADYKQIIDEVSIYEDLLHYIGTMPLFNQDEISALTCLPLWGDGRGTLPHFKGEAIKAILKTCQVILSTDLSEEGLTRIGVPLELVEEFPEFKAGIKKLSHLCESALSEALTMVFIPN